MLSHLLSAPARSSVARRLHLKVREQTEFIPQEPGRVPGTVTGRETKGRTPISQNRG